MYFDYHHGVLFMYRAKRFCVKSGTQQATIADMARGGLKTAQRRKWRNVNPQYTQSINRFSDSFVDRGQKYTPMNEIDRMFRFNIFVHGHYTI